MHHKFTPRVTATNRLKLFIMKTVNPKITNMISEHRSHNRKFDCFFLISKFKLHNSTVQKKNYYNFFFSKRAKFVKKSTKFAKPCFFVSYLPAIWKKTSINLHNPKISLVKAKTKLWKKTSLIHESIILLLCSEPRARITGDFKLDILNGHLLC